MDFLAVLMLVKDVGEKCMLAKNDLLIENYMYVGENYCRKVFDRLLKLYSFLKMKKYDH